MEVSFHKHEIPHFGETMESLALCTRCGYRHTDVMALETKEPVRYTLEIRGEKDMNIRVVRSTFATIEVPELGVKVTPGSEAEGYISNIEGVLTRIEDILLMVKGREEGEKVAKAEELLGMIKRLKEGRSRAHLIITDPTGNSAIISELAVRARLDEVEGAQ
ncbi:MAG: ZPR1 zinc finger domain-containing protein [Euryarchaeota archaeon]|nr:ZPR1 zinc finger domain-containing protein [Euryarchaeota archaeon]